MNLDRAQHSELVAGGTRHSADSQRDPSEPETWLPLRTAVPAPASIVDAESKDQRRFYRPEIDALRFFAFLSVMIHHGPATRNGLNILRATGGFGLSMFFLLSGYLITELLVSERQRTGTVAWSLFFKRRALRIWPLYFLALACAIMVAALPPHSYWVSPSGAMLMALFVVNWSMIGSQLGPLLGHLWSISVEEQFYLIWPPILKFGGKTLAVAMAFFFTIAAGIWAYLFRARGWRLWYDTPVEFLFFAAGALIALFYARYLVRMSESLRRSFAIPGWLLLCVAAAIGGIGTDGVEGLTSWRLVLGFYSAACGCTMIFIAVLGASSIPGLLAYLGKISYGLYVFHVAMLRLAVVILQPLNLPSDSTANMILTDTLALLLSIGLAHVSYQFFEKPFLKLKERYTVIKSRPV